jgi:LmbE family N-acetylglucosaminyl deacetylase
MFESLRNRRIMIVVAHPDDELLGLGATFHKLINEYNVKTHVVILGEGINQGQMLETLLFGKMN